MLILPQQQQQQRSIQIPSLVAHFIRPKPLFGSSKLRFPIIQYSIDHDDKAETEFWNFCKLIKKEEKRNITLT